jgi:hypothetical protein
MKFIELPSLSSLPIHGKEAEKNTLFTITRSLEDSPDDFVLAGELFYIKKQLGLIRLIK